MSNNIQAPMQTAMNGLWFQQVMCSTKGDGVQLELDAEMLSYGVFNPADALRCSIWVNEIEEGTLDCMTGEQAVTLCEVDEDLFHVATVPDLTRQDWERALGRLTLCHGASVRNEWRRQNGRPVEEQEDVLKAPEHFFALIESGFKHRQID